MLRELAFIALMIACISYAGIRGGGPERAVAGILVAAFVASVLAISPQLSPTSRYSQVEIGVMLVDVATWAALLCVALRANRFWPLWMAGLQGVGALAHLLGLPGSPILNLLYGILVQIWGYPMLVLLTIGTRRHRQRLSTSGNDLSWSP